MLHDENSDICVNNDAKKRRAAIKLANQIAVNDVSQVIVTGGGVQLICTKTLRKTISCKSGGLTTVIA